MPRSRVNPDSNVDDQLHLSQLRRYSRLLSHGWDVTSRVASQTQTPALLSAEKPLGPRRSLRVVVADDDKDNVLTLAALLRGEGHEVREVYRGDAVIQLVGEFNADVVFLDIGMPGMSGYEVARTLRERLGAYCPLLVAITAWKKTSERLLGQIVGFDHYFTKPYETSDVLAVLAPITAGADLRSADRRELSKEQRLLAQAAQLLGQKELAKALQVSDAALESWMEGRSSVPHSHLLNLADVLVTVASKVTKR